MLQSHVIEIDGAFVGAAVRLDTGYRFIAVDLRMEELDGTTWPSLADVRRLADRLFRTGAFVAPPDPAAKDAVSGGPDTETKSPDGVP